MPYTRVRRLSEVLDRDLGDPPTQLSRYPALLAFDQAVFDRPRTVGGRS